MTKEQMDETLAQMKRIPFENMDRLQAWMEEKLLPVFPKLFFRPAINGELLVEMGCSAFKCKDNGWIHSGCTGTYFHRQM